MHVNLFKDTTDWDELRKILGTQQQNSHWYTHEKIEWHTADYLCRKFGYRLCEAIEMLDCCDNSLVDEQPDLMEMSFWTNTQVDGNLRSSGNVPAHE